jgi:histidine ammonia-lyase
MLTLDGESLSLDQVLSVARGGEEVHLSSAAIGKMTRSRAVVERLAGGEDPVYGVNTGFGFLADKRVEPGELENLQRNVVRSHACGVGDPLPRDVVRAMMMIRANVLAKGFSGIRPVVADTICRLLNAGVTPVVPAKGSVGASGDLAPLAHMALVLIGEGEAEYGGERLPGAHALASAGVPPLTLGPKEGLSLVNGTQLMLAIGCLELEASEILADTADAICALTLDSLRGTPRAFDPRIHEARPQTGQVLSAARMRRFLEGSEIRASHLHCRRVQDAYSLRCAPQVHGAVRDALVEARRVFQIELNSATDNPLVFEEEIISGGNFHGEPLALQLDYLAVAIAVLSGISERRIDRLVNPYLNESLPAFLAEHPGLESGMMMLQVTAAALVAENRVLATPASPGSITTSGNKEDFVSMGVTAANKLRDVVRNTRDVLAIEALCATRGMEFLRPLKTSAELEIVRERLRPLVDARDDRPWSDAVAKVSHWIGEGSFRLP